MLLWTEGQVIDNRFGHFRSIVRHKAPYGEYGVDCCVWRHWQQPMTTAPCWARHAACDGTAAFSCCSASLSTLRRVERGCSRTWVTYCSERLIFDSWVATSCSCAQDTDFDILGLSRLYIYIYIYAYVCACVRARHLWLPLLVVRSRKTPEDQVQGKIDMMSSMAPGRCSRFEMCQYENS